MRLLVVAGEGILPGEVVKGARSQGYDVVVFNFSKKPIEAPQVFNFKIEDAGKALSTMETLSPDEAVMVGKVEHKIVFSSLFTKPSLLPLVRRLKGKKPMEILKTIGEIIEERGVKLVSPLKFVPHLVFPRGELVGRFSQQELKEISRAYSLAKELARMDIGQAIAWKEGAVVAVEAMEGTDRMIRRAGELVKDFTVVKVSRPSQDLRYDLPVVGPSTLEAMAEAGGKNLVFEAGKTIFLNPELSLDFARRRRIKIISWEEPENE